mmetsp:Transcript_135963/g.240352  ORF Transcript_135963/g.240352 Transcript_135963/m.240352 type:complete len:103 (+) Transcript_135963:1298-1606(+)
MVLVSSASTGDHCFGLSSISTGSSSTGFSFLKDDNWEPRFKCRHSSPTETKTVPTVRHSFQVAQLTAELSEINQEELPPLSGRRGSRAPFMAAATVDLVLTI